MSHINKTATDMNKFSPSLHPRSLCLASALAVLSAMSLRADTAYVTTYTGASVTAAPAYVPNPLGLAGVSISGSGSSSISSPPGVPSRTRCTFGFAGAVNWSIQPTLGLAGGVYTIELSHVNVGSCTSNAVFTAYSPDGTVSAGCTNFPYMQKAYGSNGWTFVGYITNNPTVTQPTIIFYYVSGQIDNSGAPGNRVYIDAFRFVQADPCYGVAGDVTVKGPLAAGQSTVSVSGVTAGATNVTVYANGNPVGETNYAPGFAAGNLAVGLSGTLNKNDSVTAGQSKNGCSSSVPGSGPLVGGGPNPAVKAFASFWKSSANTGPIGASGVTAGNPYFSSASGFVVSPGFGTAPKPGRELLPDSCWQYVSFQNGTGGDDAIDSNTGSHVTNNDTFCALEGIVFSIDSDDNGPYDIYVDQIKNGDTVIEDFEGYATGTTNTFVAPALAGNPSASLVYLAGSPNSSLTSTNYAFDGTNSCRVQWQFSDNNQIRWAHIGASASTGKHYPQVDTSKPLTMRILVLPAGTSLDHKFSGSVSSVTNSGPAYTGGTNTLGVTVTGTGPFTYQWSTDAPNGAPGTTTDRTLTLGDPNGVSGGESGTYTVAVNDGTCTETRTFVFQNTDPLPAITNQPVHAIVTAGNTANFSVGATGHVPSGYPLTYQWQTNGVDITGETSATLSLPNAQIANAGPYDVIVNNSFGSVTSAVVNLDVATVAPGNGTGLLGAYYTTHYSTNAFISATGPTLSRVDPTVDFNFGTGSPSALVSTDYFTIRWTGQVQALGDDTYTFSTISDDGVRLWVNGQKLVDNWTPHGPTTNSGSIALSGSQKYSVQFEYFEAAVSAVAKLWWSNASGGVTFEAIPAQQLYPATSSQPAVPTLGFLPSDSTNIVFSWGPGQGSIVWSTNVLGPYTNRVYGVTSPYTFTNAIGGPAQKFFRLQLQ